MQSSRVLALILLLAGCHSTARSDEASPAPEQTSATLQVENRAFSDMTVYVIDGVQRQRLGVARGNATTSFTLPDRLVRRGTGSLRFFCDPIGGRGLPVSEEIAVSPGDEVELIIPPN